MTTDPETADPRLGLVVTHRRYVPYSHAHYGGSLVDGAYAGQFLHEMREKLQTWGESDY